MSRADDWLVLDSSFGTSVVPSIKRDEMPCESASTLSISRLAARKLASDRSRLYSLRSAAISEGAVDRGSGGRDWLVSVCN